MHEGNTTWPDCIEPCESNGNLDYNFLPYLDLFFKRRDITIILIILPAVLIFAFYAQI